MDSDIPVVVLVVVLVVVVVVLVLGDVIAVVAVAPCLLPLKFSTPHQYGLPGPLLQ